MKLINRVMLPFLLVILAIGATGQQIRSLAPNGTGLANDRLERITATMNEHVAKGHFAGALGLIARTARLVTSRHMDFRTKRAAWR